MSDEEIGKRLTNKPEKSQKKKKHESQ